MQSKRTSIKTLREQFSASNPEMCDLLLMMLKFNPEQRPSANDPLANELFDSIRISKIEEGAPYKIHIDDECFGGNHSFSSCLSNEQMNQFVRKQIV